MTDRPLKMSLQRRKVVVCAGTILVLLLILLTYHHRFLKHQPFKFQLYTHNIRYDTKDLGRGEEPWKKRSDFVSRLIEDHTANGHSVVGLQEVLHHQLQDILSFLNRNDDQWAYFGVGRTDGEKKGEYSPILYKHSDWLLESSRTYWLSETPEKPSKGWDADLERIVSEVILKHRRSGKKVKVFNTHFDHKGVKARRELVKLILGKMRPGDEPSFLCGDMNTEPTDEPYAILKKAGYMDSRTCEHNPDENKPTYTGFANTYKGKIIDYIWADPQSTWLGYHVFPNMFDFLMSGHRPVVAEYFI